MGSVCDRITGLSSVFISYAHADRPRAQLLAVDLERHGFNVWWDPAIPPGATYDRVIEQAVAGATCVVVLWSETSINSDWVRAEADDGRQRGILLPVLIDRVQPPLQFRLVQTVDLAGWPNLAEPDGLAELYKGIERYAPSGNQAVRWARAIDQGTVDVEVLEGHANWASAVLPLGEAGWATSDGQGFVRTWQQGDPNPTRTWRAHARAIWSMGRLGDGYLTTSADATLKTWDGAGGARQTLSGHTDWVLGCAIGPISGVVASASADQSLRLWDPEDGRTVRTLNGHRAAVWSCDVFYRDQLVVSGGDDTTVRLWDVVTGRQLSVWRGHDAPVVRVHAMPEGSQVLSASYDKTVRLWDVSTGDTTLVLGPVDERVLCACPSPDGRLAVAGSYDGTVTLWDLVSGSCVGSTKRHDGPVMDIAFSDDGREMVTASADRTALVWRLAPPGE